MDTGRRPVSEHESHYCFRNDDGSPPLAATQSFQIVVTNASQPKLTIVDQVVVEGTLLLVTNLQGFLDITSSIVFSLDTNAPAGATLNPTNGLFAWTPTEAQGRARTSYCFRGI
jgi:hypothetical protein